MKKVLIATTALVLTAGAAAAEVKLSGTGRMGVVYNGDEWNFSSRARVIFTLSGTTDGGLEFGGSFKSHESVGANTGLDGSVYISGAFGKIEMGDVAGAPEALFGDLYEVGYTDIGNNDIPYLTGDENLTDVNNPVLLYTYSAGAFSVAASMSDGNDDTFADDQEYAIAGAYTFGNYTVGLGYEVMNYTGSTETASQVELAGMAKFGATNVKVYLADANDRFVAGDEVKGAYGLSVDSTFGATTVGAFYQKVNFDIVDDVAYYGVGASYDLGGGASIVGGVADNDMAGSDAVADLGVKFTF